jgi:hypothetical protein
VTSGNYSYRVNVRVRLPFVLQALLRMFFEPFTVFRSHGPLERLWGTCRLVPDVCHIVKCNQHSENVLIAIASKRGDSQCDN